MSFPQGLFGPPDVAELEAKRDVAGVIKALGCREDNDANVRRAATLALAKLGLPSDSAPRAA